MSVWYPDGETQTTSITNDDQMLDLRTWSAARCEYYVCARYFPPRFSKVTHVFIRPSLHVIRTNSTRQFKGAERVRAAKDQHLHVG